MSARLPASASVTLDQAHALASRLPRIMLEARRVAASLAHGVHGRRRAGAGESFWQFRPFMNGEPAARIDWRRSGRENRLFVREREWEAAHSLHFWMDRSPSMRFSSSSHLPEKMERALVLGLALSDSLVNGAERAGLLGLMPPKASRHIMQEMANALSLDAEGTKVDHPPALPVAAQDDVILISDFFTDVPSLEPSLDAIGARGARGHLVIINDPIEETFPFEGETQLLDPETQQSLMVGDAQSWGELYKARLEAHRSALSEIARAKGWTLTLHRTDRPASEAALRVLTLIAAGR